MQLKKDLNDLVYLEAKRKFRDKQLKTKIIK
jgi:hypothetical protein